MPSVKRRKIREGSSPQSSPGSSDSESSAPAKTKKIPKKRQDLNSTKAEGDNAHEEASTAPPATSAQPIKTFRDLGVIDALCEACENLGFTKPTPIQEQAIPLALEKRDLIGIAETGSGKTAAFALPILQALMDKPQSLFALVLAPTRELAYQTSQQFAALGSLISVKTAVIVGGMDIMDQRVALSKNPHIIVATPGRLLDHLENMKGFSLRHLKYLVMDEADRLLDMDFGPILDKILKVLPKEGRRTYLFSATMSSKVESLQRASLSNPLRVSVSPNTPLLGSSANGSTPGTTTSKHTTVSTLLQSYLFLPHKHKDPYLLALLSGPFAGQSCIAFARTVHEVSRLTYLLRALGLGAIPLHGQLSQSSRLSALNKFKSKTRDVLVATDVAARGLDIPSVDLVLNYDLPGDSTTYVHRVGRTARAGKSGHAVSLVTQYDVEVWLRIEKALGRKVDEFKGVGKDEAMAVGESVGEAQRVAIRQLRDEQAKKGGEKGKGRPVGKKGKRGRGDDMDKEEG